MGFDGISDGQLEKMERDKKKMEKYGGFMMDSIGFGDPEVVEKLIECRRDKRGTISEKREKDF